MASHQPFSDLVQLIRAHCEDGSASSSRRAPRLEYSCRLSIQLGESETAGPEEEVALKDISARGLCFLHASQMSPGTKIVAHIREDGGAAAAVLCTVANCRPLADGNYAIGVNFVKVLVGNAADEPTLQEPTDPEDYMCIRGNLTD
jgi:PilZ domain